MSLQSIIVTVVAAGIAAAILAVFLLGGDPPPSADADNPELVALGETVYAEHCASCHGADLEGQPNWRFRYADGTQPAPPHDASGHTWHHPDQVLFEVTRNGGAESAPTGFKSAMPGFGEVLADTEIWAVLAFIKSRWPQSIRRRHDLLNQD